MTLNDFIEQLTMLRDHYLAGDYEVRTRQVNLGIENSNEILSMENTPMDGDDFFLNRNQQVCYVDCKGFEATQHNIDELPQSNQINKKIIF